MDRDTVRPVLIGLLVVLAIATAAATLANPAVNDSGGGSGFGSNPDSTGLGASDQPSQGDDSGFELLNSSTGRSIRPICFPILFEPWVVFGIIGVFALASAHTHRRVGIFGPIVVLGGFGIPVFLLYNFLTSCPTGDPKGGGIIPILMDRSPLPQGGVTGFGGGDGGVVGSAVSNSPPSVILTLILGVALVAAVAMFFSATGDDATEEEEPEPEPEAEDPDIAAMSRVAGAAADRIEDDADVTNEVFSAWREMTDLLPVDRPRSSTPAEFATAAAEAGMARDDIDELTHLFEEVRYGGREATGDREERAIAALRRIETAYGEDER